jgi:hypothetical protein
MEAIQEKNQKYIVKDMHGYGDSELSNIIEIGTLNTGLDSTWVPSINDTSKKWKMAVRDQSRIGWDHLLRGRILKTLIQSMNKHFESQNLSAYLYNGDCWAKKLITAIWSTMLELWKTRNNIIYSQDTAMAEAMLREKLETCIRRCYKQRSILKAQERAHWFSTLLEERLQQDAQRAVNWLQGAEQLIKITRREQKRRPQESIILENFLLMSNPQINGDTRATDHPQAFAQELNPD